MIDANPPRRFGIDAHIVGAGKGGVERFLHEVCQRLPVLRPQHHYTYFCNARAIASGILRPASNVDLVPLPFANPLIERALVLPLLSRKHGLDALLVQRLGPWGMGRCRVVLTVHDITPIKFPEQYRGLTNALIRALTASSIRRSDVVLTPSLHVGSELAALSGEAADKFHAYYNGVDFGMFRALDGKVEAARIVERLGLRAPFAFTCGALERRKNVETMIRAMRLVPVESCAQLVVAGGTRDAAYAKELRAAAAQAGVDDRVTLMGFVSESDLADLYRTAAVFVTASRDEGFNMPLLEAMMSGVATVCSDIPVHRELFDGAADFFPADDVGALAAQLRQVLDDEAHAQALIAAGMARARAFSWDGAAERVVATLEHAGGVARYRFTAGRP